MSNAMKCAVECSTYAGSNGYGKRTDAAGFTKCYGFQTSQTGKCWTLTGGNCNTSNYAEGCGDSSSCQVVDVTPSKCINNGGCYDLTATDEQGQYKDGQWKMSQV